MLAGAILGLQSVSCPRWHALGSGLTGQALREMRTLRILLDLFLKNRRHATPSDAKDSLQDPTIFGAWIGAYRQRLDQDCGRSEVSRVEFHNRIPEETGQK